MGDPISDLPTGYNTPDFIPYMVTWLVYCKTFPSSTIFAKNQCIFMYFFY